MGLLVFAVEDDVGSGSFLAETTLYVHQCDLSAIHCFHVTNALGGCDKRQDWLTTKKA